MLNKDNSVILVSTILSRLNKAIKLAEKAYLGTGIRSIISCQTYEQSNLENDEQITSAFSLYFTNTRGLSYNRNYALSKSDAKYVWFLDDDVQVTPSGACEAFKVLQNSEFSVISTCYTIDGGGPRKKYRSKPFTHDRFSIMKVSSIEILCDRDALIRENIEFDSRFGLGALYKSGEENIFLASCLDSGLKVGFYPINTSSHPDETSGGVYSDVQQLVSKGAIIRKVYGIWGWPFVVAFFLKRLKNKELSFSSTCFAIWHGTIGFFKERAARK